MIINGNHFNFEPINRIITEPKIIKNDILYALISIYYYEKTLWLNNKKESIFNEHNFYYFINPNWIINFKKLYNYQILSQYLKHINSNGKPLTYNNYEQNINSIKIILSRNKFIFKNNEIPENLKHNIMMTDQKAIEKISYYPYCYIIDMRIKNIIQNYVFAGNNLTINEQKVFAKDSFIYLSAQNTITIGKLNQNFIFISYYVIIVKPQLLSTEILLLSYYYSFDDYLKYRHIEKFNSYKQPIKDENNIIIGGIIILQKTQANNGDKISNLSKENSMGNNSNEQLKKIASNINSNNSLENNKNINQLLNNKIDISKQKNIPPTIKTSLNENIIKISQSYGPKDNNSPKKIPQNQKINELSLYGQSNLVNKDNIYFKGNAQDITFREDGNQLKSDMKINQEFFNLKLKLEEKERELQNLRKENNDLQIKIKTLNDFNNLKSNLENEFNIRKEQLDKREILIIKKEQEFNENQNILNDLISKKNELIEKERNLKERENIILIKEKEILYKENELNKRKELYKKDDIENNMNKRENIISNKEEEINPQPIPPFEPDPILSYEQPTLIGLNNIGATCFMNSTLQCLSQTPDLTNYFLKDSKKGRIINNNLAKENNNSLQLSPIYLKLIQKLWDKEGKESFSPNEFMNTIEKMNPLFKKGQAGDSKDFIIFILEQIHKELKSKINRNYNVEQPFNQYDRNNAFVHFMNDFTKDCSIISDAFFGFTETTNECLNCKKNYNSQNLKNPICYNFGIFNCLIFPLEEVKTYKNNMIMQYFYNMNNMSNMSNMSYVSNISNITQSNSVTLDNCFSYNQKTDLFTGENKNYCNICRQLFDSYFTSKIYSCPNNLIIILNRGKNNIYNIKLYFTETIDITKYVVCNNGNKWIYNLYGVITHIGESGPNAHFVASCKSPVDNKWYRYNDAFVNPINDVQNEIINFGTPYILFYQKNKNI